MIANQRHPETLAEPLMVTMHDGLPVRLAAATPWASTLPPRMYAKLAGLGLV